MAPLRAREAAYEYWFLKANAGELAFLVDFIVRRPSASAEVRLSYWVRGRGTVTHDVRDRWATAAPIAIGDAEFGEGRTHGASCGVRWDIAWLTGPRWLEPGRIGGMLRAFPTQIALCPGARATGTVDIAGERFALDAASAVVAHYWSRRLPDRWVWLSANTPELDVEALFATQRLWGLPFLGVAAGYVYMSGAGRTRYVIAPLTGVGGAGGTRRDVRVRAWGPRAGRIEIAARSGTTAQNDLGEGITQTLLADGDVNGRAIRGVMGLETRGWS